MAFIWKEIPTGVIDWVNKVFTLLNDVDYIDDIFYDWWVTSDYTRVWKIITMTYAPQSSIYVDYYDKTAQSITTSTYTFLDIKNKVWALLWAKSTSTNFSSAIVWDEINRQGRAIWKGRIINKLNPRQIFKAGFMYFKDLDYVVRIKSWWTVTAEVNVWDTDIKINTTGLLWAGYIEVWWDIIKYTSKTATQINWVTWITINHLVWEKAVQLYETPNLIDKVNILEKVKNGASLWEIPYNNWYVHYEIIRKEVTLLKIIWLTSDDLVKVKYTKQFPNMSLDTDECPFPEDYWINVLAYLVAGSLWYDKWVPNSQNLLNSWYTSLQVMYGDFGAETSKIITSIKPTYKPKRYL